MGISANEYESRHHRIREAMEREGFDVLIVAGREDIYSRGNMRYITDLSGDGYVVFPKDEKPIHFMHPVMSRSPKLSPVLLDYVTIQTYADGAYGDPVPDVMGEMHRLGADKKVGFVGMREIGSTVYQAVTEFVTEAPRDATHILRDARLIKTPEMLESMRTSARIADEACTILMDMVKPGVTDYEVYAAVKEHLYKNGSEYSLEVIDAQGANFNFTWVPTGEVLEDGGTLFMEITPAYGGVYAQLPFSLLIGAPGEELLAMKAAWAEGFAVGESMLKPGTKVSDLCKAIKKVINDRGFLTPFAQGHSIGFDVVDGWAISDHNDLELQPGMTMALHPAAVKELGGAGYTSGATYLITEDGHEKLSVHDFSR